MRGETFSFKPTGQGNIYRGCQNESERKRDKGDWDTFCTFVICPLRLLLVRLLTDMTQVRSWVKATGDWAISAVLCHTVLYVGGRCGFFFLTVSPSLYWGVRTGWALPPGLTNTKLPTSHSHILTEVVSKENLERRVSLWPDQCVNLKYPHSQIDKTSIFKC